MKNKEETYNGWSNYETWAVNLWLTDDNYHYEDFKRLYAEARNDKGKLAQMIKDYIEEICPDLGCTMFADLLYAALSDVDFYELAEHYIKYA